MRFAEDLQEFPEISEEFPGQGSNVSGFHQSVIIPIDAGMISINYVPFNKIGRLWNWTWINRYDPGD